MSEVLRALRESADVHLLRRMERPPPCRDRAAAADLLRKRDACRLGALRALCGLELHLRALGQRLVALADDRAVVDEQVLTAYVGGDEPVPLVGVKPLHGSSCHG